MNAFNNPRILPCIHTFCLECLKLTAETAQNKPGDNMLCPLCRKEFIIPEDGIDGIQKNFFMENLLEFKTTLRMGSATIICDMCNVRKYGEIGQIPTATMRCLECQDNYCDSCGKVHQFQKASKDHQMATTGSDPISVITPVHSIKSCTKHPHKTLEYYCPKYKKIVCVSCFVECHASHECKDVTTVDKEFRQTIQRNAIKISKYADEILSMRMNTQKRKIEFLTEIVDKENEIRKINQNLKDMIDENTKSLLNELSEIKSNYLEEIEIEMDEIDRCSTILNNFEAYCTELRSKGSASDICSSVDQLIVRGNQLEKDQETFIGRPRISFEVSFESTHLMEYFHKSNHNAVGEIKETTTQFENCAIFVGLNDGTTITKDVIKINLRWPCEIVAQQQIPARMQKETTAIVNRDTIYITGIGANNNEILKYQQVFGWMKCGSLVQGRSRHRAAFIDDVVYICGGFVESKGCVIDSVEVYDTVTDKCSIVGKLVHCVHSSGNCVRLRSSLYIFGGMDKDGNDISHVQVYDTKHNTCTVISNSMPRPFRLMRAAVWETSVILHGRHTCFIFNFETETWQEREQFRTDVVHFGLALENERFFVIGGGIDEKDKDGKMIWKCRDDIRYVPLQNVFENKPIEWKVYGKLPKPSLVQAFVNMRYPV